MSDSGMLGGEIPSFAEPLARISQLEEQCNAIARPLSWAATRAAIAAPVGPVERAWFCASSLRTGRSPRESYLLPQFCG